jgi:hypothetical protein
LVDRKRERDRRASGSEQAVNEIGYGERQHGLGRSDGEIEARAICLEELAQTYDKSPCPPS